MKLTEVILLSFLLIFLVSSKAFGDSANDDATTVTAEGSDPTEKPPKKLTTGKDATTSKPSAGSAG